MNIQELKELIQLMDQTAINDFQYQKDGYKIRIRKNGDESERKTVVHNSTSATPVIENINSLHIEKQTTGTEVKSPLVGVFYSSPNPTSPSFVKVGQRVKKGDVLCIVEAMKIMNEIVSELDGIVTEICVENETLVEYGQPLVKIG